MTSYVARHAPAAALALAGDALHGVARRLDAWLAARARSIEDSRALAAMSERELRDIGLDPARVRGGAHVYLREHIS